MKIRKPIKAPIHVMWMGTKPSKDNAGMDTVSVDLLRRAFPEQEIVFYCLNSEAAAYQTYFDEREPSVQKVEVRGIESYIESCGVIEHPFVAAKYPTDLGAAFNAHVENIKDRVEGLSETKDKIREWVGLKELLTYFLQIREEGYFIDSNVIPNGKNIVFSRAFRASQMYNPEIRDVQWDPYIVLSVRSKDPEYADAELEDSKRRFLQNLVETQRYLKACVDEQGLILPQAEVINESLAKGRSGKHPNMRLLIATLFVNGVAVDARPIRMTLPEGASHLSGLAASNAGFSKRFLNTHAEDSFLQTLPLTHRIVLGPFQSEELCYYLEKRPNEDIFQTHCYPEELETNSVRDFSLVERVKSLGLFDKLGSMLAYSNDARVFEELEKSSEHPDCLKHYLEEMCWRSHLISHQSYEGVDIALFISHLTTSLGLEEKQYEDIDEIVLDFQENPFLRRAIKCLSEKGPLEADNIDSYVMALKTESEQDEFDEVSIREALGQCLDPLSTSKRYES